MNMEEIREEVERGDGAGERKEGVRVRVVRGDYWEIGADVGLVCECGPNWTVRELKLHLQASLPDVPEAECLRVICAGRELRDEEVMAAVVPRGASTPYTLHVINAGRIHRRFVYSAPSTPSAPAAPNAPSAPAPTQNAGPAEANEDLAMTYWQQAYRNYYYQSLLCQYWAMAYERQAAAAEAGATAPAVLQPEQPAPVQAREQLPEEEEGDWWERAYGVFRLCAVVCLMYAYSTTGRIVLLLVVLVALMVVRPGQWRRLQAVQRPAALQPEDPEILMPEDPAPEAPAAGGPAPEALAPEVPAPEVPAPDAIAPDAPVRHSLFAAGWLIITTFFTSLIPDVTE